jgi:hypothetical protein
MTHQRIDDPEAQSVIPRRHILRSFTWAAVAGVAVMTLAACGGNGEDEGDEGGEEEDD